MYDCDIIYDVISCCVLECDRIQKTRNNVKLLLLLLFYHLSDGFVTEFT